MKPLTTDERVLIEGVAKERAKRHFLETNPRATAGQVGQAVQFAERCWRQPEFLNAGLETVALHRAIDEKEAAPNN